VADAPRSVVVVDGSNLATEGRSIPSLKQLDEAVRAYAVEDPDAEIVVVVDASFEHRIDPSERAQLEEAELHGEVVSPPAGAIGRGDAFVLRIAERTGARVLSNDSFQEFHGQHPWLFDQGRLVGGKPVPGVGWIFTPRLPVRGARSKESTSKARRHPAATLPAPVKAAELAKAAKKAAKKAADAATGAAKRRAPVLPDGSAPKVGDVWRPESPPAGGTGAEGPAADGRRAARGRGSREALEPSVPRTGARKSGAEEAAVPPKTKDTTKAAKGPTTAKKAVKQGGDGKQGKAEKRGRRKEAAVDVSPDRASLRAVPTKRVAKRSAAGDDGEAAAKAGPARKAKGPGAVTLVPDSDTAAAAPGRARSVPDEPAPGKPSRQVSGKAAAKARTKKAANRATPPSAAAEGPAPAGKPPRVSAASSPSAAAPSKGDKGAKAATAAAATAATRPTVVATRATESEETRALARAGRSRGREDPAVRQAIDAALAEAVSTPDAGDGEKGAKGRGTAKRRDGKTDPKASKRRRSRGAAPPPAVNEPLAFITFVAAYPLYSEVPGEVVSFTSHGAMVDVDLPGGGALHSYIPLTGMGDPPPTKARQVLSRGERRDFVLVGLDPPRRVAELALPGVAVVPAPAS
jgi:hypothetical protein